MKISGAQKLFLGMKVDAAMKRHLDEGDTKGRPLFKPGDPAHLETVREGEDLYIGRIVDAGFPIDQIEDLKRNIKSIVGLTFPDSRSSGASLRIFALEIEPDATLAVAG